MISTLEVTAESTSEPLPGRASRQVWRIVRDRELWLTAISVGDQAIVAGTSFATSLMVGRFGSKADLGLYFLIYSLVFLARGIQEQLISAPYYVYAPRRLGPERARYTGSVLVHQATFSALALLAFAMGWVACNLMGAPPGMLRCLLVASVTLPWILLRECVRQFAMAHLEVVFATLLDLLVGMLQVAILLGLLLDGADTPFSAILAMGLASAVGCAVWWAGRQPQLAFAAGEIRNDWLVNWSFGRWALASHLLGIAAPQLLPWILAASQGAEATGSFVSAMTLVGISSMLATGIGNYFSPRAAHAYARGGVLELTSVLKRMALLLSLLLGGLCLVVFVTGDLLVVLAFGSDYAGVGPLLALLMVNALGVSLGSVAGCGLWALERPQAGFAADCIKLIAMCFAALVMVPLWGTMGAGWAMLLGTILGGILRGFTLRLRLSELASRTDMPGERHA